jgi:hypothetical protein
MGFNLLREWHVVPHFVTDGSEALETGKDDRGTSAAESLKALS